MTDPRHPLPTGIVPILQTPFLQSGKIDVQSFDRLVEDAIQSGASGLVYPAVASEVDSLSVDERQELLHRLVSLADKRVAVVAGASSNSSEESRARAIHAFSCGTDCLLLQPTASAQRSSDSLTSYLLQVTNGIDLPLILQDLDWNGPGMPLATILETAEAVPVLQGIKVETQPAGPKYTAIRDATAGRLHVSGGWAVTEMLDGLARGVDAFMPEASMVRVYRTIWDAYHASDTVAASARFDEIAPILAFSNQHIDVSIQFFKRVLVQRKIFTTTYCRAITQQLNVGQIEEADRHVEMVVRLLDGDAWSS